tara:strand:+ start:1116 stop:1343 length:228 start_codon:yes stop_codon:yes gene_type:complete
MTLEKVIKIIANQTSSDVDDIGINSSMENVDGWDSVTYVEIILSLEEEFQIEFSSLESASLNNVASILEILDSKI